MFPQLVKSKVNLHIDKKAIIFSSPEKAHYFFCILKYLINLKIS